MSRAPSIDRFLTNNRAEQQQIEQIEGFLREHGPRYEKVLKELKNIVKTFAETPHGRRLIHDVTSRKDYQIEQELKDPLKIYHNMRQEKKTSVWQVEDIVGIRVIYRYPSDLKPVIAFIKEIPDIVIKNEKVKKDLRTGYQAYHLRVALNTKDPTMRGIRCEIQLRSILEEAWSVKTHGLIYKGTQASTEHEKHAKLLAETIRGIDEQSEIVKDQIEAARRIQSVFRKACMQIAAQVAARWTQVKEAQRRRALKGIWSYIHRNEKALDTGEVRPLLSRFEAYARKYKVDRELCRQILYLAILRKENDCDKLLLEYADRLIEQLSKSPLGLLFKGTALVYLGHVGSAVDLLVKAFEHSRKTGEKDEIARCAGYLAYALAERGNPRDAETASDLAGLARKVFPNQPEYLDTEGYIKIVFGRTAGDILAGRDLCSKALSDFRERGESWRRFVFQYHEYIAFSRLSLLSFPGGKSN